MIYFAMMGRKGPIKIGHTAGSVPGRLKALESEYLVFIELLGVCEGDLAYEKRLHRRFAVNRFWKKAGYGYRRELFRPSTELMEFIKENSRELLSDEGAESLRNPVKMRRVSVSLDSRIAERLAIAARSNGIPPTQVIDLLLRDPVERLYRAVPKKQRAGLKEDS